MSTGGCDGDRDEAVPSKRLVIVIWLAAWVFTVAGQWWIIDRFGGGAPYLDQWDAEVEGVVVPLVSGQAIDWWRPHNEHRIVLTRATTWALYRLNGDVWDPKLEQNAGALLFATAWITWGLAWARRRSVRWQLGTAAVVAIAGALPFGYENVLWGFQNQLGWLLWGAALVALGLSGRTRWKRFIVVAVGLAVSMLAMGSGGLAGAALVVTVICHHRSLWPREHEARVFVLVGLCAVGGMLALRTVVAGHAMLRPDNPGTVAVAALRCLAWPWQDAEWIGTVLWLPLGLGIVRWLRTRSASSGNRAEPAQLVIIFAGAWALLQVVALVLTRGVPLAATGPTSRYTGVLLVGLLAGGAAVAMGRAIASSGRSVARWSIAAWIAILVSGAVLENWRLAHEALPGWSVRARAQTQRLRAFWVSDEATLLSGQPWVLTGYPDGDRLVTWLRDPVVRSAVAFSVWADPREAGNGMPQLSRWARVAGSRGWTMGLVLAACAAWSGVAVLSRRRGSSERR